MMNKVNKFYNSLEELYEDFDQDDILDELEDYEEHAGKHDVTNCEGYFFSEKYQQWYNIAYGCSYTNGVETCYVEGPFNKFEEIVSVKKNSWKAA